MSELFPGWCPEQEWQFLGLDLRCRARVLQFPESGWLFPAELCQAFELSRASSVPALCRRLTLFDPQVFRLRFQPFPPQRFQLTPSAIARRTLCRSSAHARLARD